MAIIVKSTSPDGSVNIATVKRVQYLPRHIDGAAIFFADEAAFWCGRHECFTEHGAALLDIDLGEPTEATANATKSYYARLSGRIANV